jgi:DNA-binding MarR family transcriptional regulator
MTAAIDISVVSRCTCLSARRATRHLTQVYDHALKPAGLTVSQFGLLANLYGAALSGRRSLSIGALAAQLGMDPTTLNRNLKPLTAQGLVADAADGKDRRTRSVHLTAKGRARLRKAVPLWQGAQERIEAALGGEATAALNNLLQLTSAKLAK